MMSRAWDDEAGHCPACHTRATASGVLPTSLVRRLSVETAALTPMCWSEVVSVAPSAKSHVFHLLGTRLGSSCARRTAMCVAEARSACGGLGAILLCRCSTKDVHARRGFVASPPDCQGLRWRCVAQ